MAPIYKAAGTTADQVRVWRIEDPARVTEWDTARAQSADAYADMILETANSAAADSNAARVKIQALQWIASRRDPRTYGDKAQVDVNVRTIDLTRIIQDANARLAATRIIEGEVLKPALADLM